jgi:pyruvate,water dikinase
VEELAEIHARQPELAGTDARRLKLGVPMDIRVLDIGEGTALDQAGDAGGEITLEQLTCAPLTAFLAGLCRKDAWRTDPAALSAGDVVGGMRKAYELMNDPAAAAGQNLAIVARGYMNLSLRLGYHFSVVDAHLGDNPNQNSIYFRFVGGLADEHRRERRAKLIRIILEGLGFQVVVSGDLVVGKFKVADRPDMELVLARLGELTAFTRQLDTDLASDGAVAHQAQSFLGLEGQVPVSSGPGGGAR